MSPTQSPKSGRRQVGGRAGATPLPGPAPGRVIARSGRPCASAVAAMLVLVISAGCGSGGLRGGAIAKVGDHSITRQALAHWMSVVAVRNYELIPRAAVPAWVRPSPPRFTACVDHLTAAEGTATKASKGQLLRQCRREYEELRKQTISFLISCNALIAEAEAKSVRITNSDIVARMARVKRNEFGDSPARFRRYLALSGETIEDQRFRAMVKVATEKMEGKILAERGVSLKQRGRKLVEFSEQLPIRWAAKTNCAAGYVVPNCKEYRGRAKPRLVI